MTVNTNGNTDTPFLPHNPAQILPSKDKILTVEVLDYNGHTYTRFTQVVQPGCKASLRPQIVMEDGSPGFLQFEITVEDV